MATRRTVNKKPVPVEDEHLIPSSLTDQGLEDAEEYGSGAAVTRDGGFDAGLEKFEAQLWDAHDPMSEKLREFKERHPDQAFRFLSDRVVDRRGMRGFKPVIDKDGDPVSVAGMKLARMPQQHADRRNAHYADQYREEMSQAVDAYQESQDRTIRDAGALGEGFAPLAPGSRVTDTGDPDSTASIGLTRRRGARAA